MSKGNYKWMSVDHAFHLILLYFPRHTAKYCSCVRLCRLFGRGKAPMLDDVSRLQCPTLCKCTFITNTQTMHYTWSPFTPRYSYTAKKWTQKSGHKFDLDTQHSDPFSWALVLALLFSQCRTRECPTKWTDRQMDGCCQVHYLPASLKLPRQ